MSDLIARCRKPSPKGARSEIKCCTKCRTSKPPAEFNHDRSKCDGLQSRCRCCSKTVAAAWHSANPEKMKAKVNGYRAANPERTRAHRAVERAIFAGRMTKRACSVCGAEGADAHHPDYSRPLEVVWLCRQHHNEEHKRIERNAA